MLKEISAPAVSALSRFGNSIYPDRNARPLIISGSPRGGTTWAAESVARLYSSDRILWEPLQDGNISARGLPLGKRPFLQEGRVEKSVDDFFSALLSGKCANAHLLRLRQHPQNILSLFGNRPPVIKFVRGNGVVGYLRRHFDLPLPLVMIRHPCAVVASQLKMGIWSDHPHVDAELLNRMPKLRSVVRRNAPLHLRLAMTWAGDVLAARENAEDVQCVYYEDLVERGSSTLWPVLQSWGWGEPPASMGEVMAAPSSTTHEWSTVSTAEEKLKRWQTQLAPEIINDVLEVCHHMGVEDYCEGLRPRSG